MSGRPSIVIIGISAVAGAGDFLTGVALVVAPEMTLQLMLAPPVNDWILIRYIGIFVACVGACYGIGLWSWYAHGSSSRLQFCWEVTALFRLGVAGFVGVACLLRQLPPIWTVVAAVDFFWAALQLGLLRARYFGLPSDEI